jgi:RNA polymerase sigma-70 factor (ECF subfamily)
MARSLSSNPSPSMPSPSHAARPDPLPPSDAALLERVASGELAPLGVLYDRHWEGVRQFVVKATGDGPDADDITQEAFLTLATIASRYDGRASARPLLVGIAAQHLRQRKRGVARLFQVLSAFATTSAQRHEATPEDAARVSEDLRRFERALAGLSEDKRLVVLLVEREGLTGEEAARALGVPLNTVWTRLHYARAELRSALEHDGKG